jgi:hypothetical protein
MAVPEIRVQFNGLLESRYSFVRLPREKFGLSNAVAFACLQGFRSLITASGIVP